METLWAIAAALRVPFGRLVEDERPEVRVVRASEQPAVRGTETGQIGRLLAAAPRRGTFELYSIDQAGPARHADPHHAGVVEYLLVVEGENPGTRAELADAPPLIGRGSDAAIKLDDDYVSTRHARIAASGYEWFVEDLGSTNGTYVGPVRITQPTTIGLGVQVRVGKTILELRK